jgi:hypothetical protein
MPPLPPLPPSSGAAAVSLHDVGDRLARERRQELLVHARRLRRVFLWVSAITVGVVGAGWIVLNLVFCGCCEGRADTARNQAYEVSKAMEIFRLQHGRWPTSLLDLTVPPRGKPVMNQLPLDPWGGAWRLAMPTTWGPLPPGARASQRDTGKPIVWSAGEDGIFLTDDDVGNWPR